MMKDRFHVAGKLVAVLLLGITVAGCAISRYGIEIDNVKNIKAIYIRNAGTTDWGYNMLSDMKNITKSKFSEMVDIKVLDTNGVVYSKYNVSFNDTAFVESGKTSSLNLFAQLGLAGALVAVLFLMPKPDVK